MNFNKPSFRFRKKKKSRFPSLEALKTISMVTGSALAMNKALKQKLQDQQKMLLSKKQQESNDTAAILAGIVGGLVAGSIVALLFAPESGDRMRDRISGFFLSEEENGFEETLERARRSAKEKLGLNGGS